MRAPNGFTWIRTGGCVAIVILALIIQRSDFGSNLFASVLEQAKSIHLPWTGNANTSQQAENQPTGCDAPADCGSSGSSAQTPQFEMSSGGSGSSMPQAL